MESVFDRLARQISGEERRTLLARIGKSYKSEPLHKGITSSDEPYVPERQFARLSLFTRLLILISGFLSGIGRDRAIERFLLRKNYLRLSRLAPGLLDSRRSLISPKLYQIVAELRSAVYVFKETIFMALEENKSEFYAFLGKLELENIQMRLETELIPSIDGVPNTSHLRIKKQLFSALNAILGDIDLAKRRQMNTHINALFQLRSLTNFPYNRILNLFPRSGNDSVAGAKTHALRVTVLELGDALFAFKTPPSPILLKALFLFDLRDATSEDSEWLEKELRERMSLTSHALDIIRKVNAAIPWELLLKFLAADIHYMPTVALATDDWFRVFKQFWTELLNVEFREWSNQQRVRDLLNELKEQYELAEIPLISGYRKTEFPEHCQPRYELSFAVVRVLFLEIFQGKLYHALNIVRIDGKFYKKDNRKEFEEVFNRFIKIPDKIRSFESKLHPEGEYGIQLGSLWQENSSGVDNSKHFFELLDRLDRESQMIAVPLINDLRRMSNLLEGILSGSGGTYDSLSNMSEIGGYGDLMFFKNLKEVRDIFNRSAKNIKKLMELEEKLSSSGAGK